MNKFLVAFIVLVAISSNGAIPLAIHSGIEEVSHIPKVEEVSEISHTSELSHVSEVSQIPEVSHITEVSTTPEIVSEVAHIEKIVEPLIHKEEAIEYGPKSYNFKYGVNDPLTGDVKSQHEVSHGGVVHGEYSVKEADGTIRIVKYTADKHNGFNAKVYKVGHSVHPTIFGHHHISGSAAEHSHASSELGHH